MGIACQAGEKFGDFFFTHLRRVSFVMKEDKPLDPPNIGLFGFDAIVTGADGLTDLVEELWLWRDRS